VEKSAGDTLAFQHRDVAHHSISFKFSCVSVSQPKTLFLECKERVCATPLVFNQAFEDFQFNVS